MDTVLVTRADYGADNEYEQFTMDKPGNRTSVTLRDTSTETYTVDNQTNQYSQIGAAALDYDDAGNLITDDQGYNYDYDREPFDRCQ